MKEVLDTVILTVNCIRRNGWNQCQFKNFPEKLLPEYEEDVWYFAVKWLNILALLSSICIYDRQQ